MMDPRYPKIISVSSRCHVIVWLFALVVLSFLCTVTFSSVINGANTLSPLTITSGTNAGTIRHRLYESLLNTKQGGMLIDMKSMDTTNGMHQMVINRQMDESVSHRCTLLLFYRHIAYFPRQIDDVHILKVNTVINEMSHADDKFSYYILIKNMADYEFLANLTHNRDVSNTCNGLLVDNCIKVGNREEVNTSVFPTFAETCLPSIITISIIIFVCCCFGVFYELRNGSIRCCKSCFLI